jgi:hypothetical protein
MIEISKEEYILGQWFSESKDFANITALIVRGENETTWVGQIRYRIYADEGRDDPFSGKDKKKFFDIVKKDTTEEAMIDYMNKLFDHLSECPEIGFEFYDHPFVCDHVLIQGNLNTMLEKCKDKPWFHVKIKDNK